MDTDTLLTRFEREYMEINSISPKRRVEQLRLLRRFALSLDRPLDEMTAGDVAAFIGADIARGVHPNTARKRVGMIRSFTNWATSAQIATPTLASEVKLLGNPRGSTSRSRPHPYKVEQVKEFKLLLAERYPLLPNYGRGSHLLRRFLQRGAPRLRGRLWRHAVRLQFEAQVALALEEGLRRIEIFRLSIPALHYDNDDIVVLTAKQGPGSPVTRAIPYAAHARTRMEQWLDFRSLLGVPHDEPWLMLCRQGTLDEQLAPQTERAFGRSLERFGDWEWRRFRHTAATEWLRSGVPIEQVCVYMGHATIEQTRAYTEILNTDLRRSFGDAEADFAKRLGLAA